MMSENPSSKSKCSYINDSTPITMMWYHLVYLWFCWTIFGQDVGFLNSYKNNSIWGRRPFAVSDRRGTWNAQAGQCKDNSAKTKNSCGPSASNILMVGTNYFQAWLLVRPESSTPNAVCGIVINVVILASLSAVRGLFILATVSLRSWRREW